MRGLRCGMCLFSMSQIDLLGPSGFNPQHSAEYLATRGTQTSQQSHCPGMSGLSSHVPWLAMRGAASQPHSGRSLKWSAR